MIIVNQKKDGIVNFNNVKNLWIDSEKDEKEDIEINKSVSIYADEKLLGKYGTEKRANEVLNSIKAAYQANKILECSGSIDQNIIAEKFLENKMLPFQYEMPEE